jgi:hypothetical protein
MSRDSIDRKNPPMRFTRTFNEGGRGALSKFVGPILDTAANRNSQPHAVPLAVFVANRPHAGDDEPVPRRENLSGPKLEAEGTPAEVQIVLGWEMNTRALLVLLPFDKFVAWTSDISDTI